MLIFSWPINLNEKMILTLRKSLRPDVAYITVVLRAKGLVSNRGLATNRAEMTHIMEHIPNVLVLSSGGYGHVPVPLLRHSEELLQKPFFKPMKERELLVSYMGSDRHTPGLMRKKMIEMVKEDGWFQENFIMYLGQEFFSQQKIGGRKFFMIFPSTCFSFGFVGLVS